MAQSPHRHHRPLHQEHTNTKNEASEGLTTRFHVMSDTDEEPTSFRHRMDSAECFMADDFFDTPANFHNSQHRLSFTTSASQTRSRVNTNGSVEFFFPRPHFELAASPPTYHSPTSPYSFGTEPLLLPPTLQTSDDDTEAGASRDHPLRLPFARLSRHPDGTTHHIATILSGLNILNLWTYLVSLTVAIVLASGWIHTRFFPSTWHVTSLAANDTLLTPAPWAGEYLWLPVYVAEGVFSAIQLLPRIRTRPELVHGVGFVWFYTGIFQVLAIVFYCLQWLIPAWFALACTTICLLYIQFQQRLHYGVSTSSIKNWEYWIFRFPFDFHLAWLLPLLASHGSMIFRRYGQHNVGLQLAADIVLLALLLPCAGFFALRSSHEGPPDWMVPLMIVWAYLGIACRLLKHPPDDLMNQYGADIVVAVRDAAFCFAGAVALLILPQIVVWIAREFCTIQVVQLDEDQVDEEQDGDENNDEAVEKVDLTCPL